MEVISLEEAEQTASSWPNFFKALNYLMNMQAEGIGASALQCGQHHTAPVGV